MYRNKRRKKKRANGANTQSDMVGSHLDSDWLKERVWLLQLKGRAYRCESLRLNAVHMRPGSETQVAERVSAREMNVCGGTQFTNQMQTSTVFSVNHPCNKYGLGWAPGVTR